jgi:arginyl-tRNA synthetase
MGILPHLKDMFRPILLEMVGDDVQVEELLNQIRRCNDPVFGDYQANFAMLLGKQLGRPPREVAAEIIDRLKES